MQRELSLTEMVSSRPPEGAEDAMARLGERKNERRCAANLGVRLALANDAMGAMRGGCGCALGGDAMLRVRSGETRRDDSRERGRSSGGMADEQKIGPRVSRRKTMSWFVALRRSNRTGIQVRGASWPCLLVLLFPG